jgi:hypothetical protein
MNSRPLGSQMCAISSTVSYASPIYSHTSPHTHTQGLALDAMWCGVQKVRVTDLGPDDRGGRETKAEGRVARVSLVTQQVADVIDGLGLNDTFSRRIIITFSWQSHLFVVRVRVPVCLWSSYQR